VVLEANLAYWDPTRFPQLQRIIFDNTISQKEAVEQVKADEGRIDLVTDLSPLETLRVAQSPAAQVVKNRKALTTVLGVFNRRKVESPWHDVRLRQAVNYAINREDLIQYATKGNGVIIPALVSAQGFGYDADLAPYPFDPATARRLLLEAGYDEGLTLSLIASEALQVQATVVSKMLEQVGFTVDLQILDGAAFNRKTYLGDLDQPPEHQPWDIALTSWRDSLNFPVFQVYRAFALDGYNNWGIEDGKLHQLHDAVLQTVDREQQQALIRQMERHTHDQAYFLFLYNPIQLYAVNKAVTFVPYVTMLNLAETGVTEEHWSVRKQKASTPE
jgi:peptide/nickel transport system substrate-binding protein